MGSSQPNSRRERESGSFLVRLWREPGNEAAPLRCFVRNLHTGAEQYLAGSDDLVRVLALEFEAEGAVEGTVGGGAA